MGKDGAEGGESSYQSLVKGLLVMALLYELIAMLG